MQREVINPPEVFDSLRYGFSQAVGVSGGRRLHLSGQVAADAAERTTSATLAGQLRDCFDNLGRVLAAAGARMEHVTVLRLYLVQSPSLNLAEVSEALRERFPLDPPAATWLIVSGLARDDWLVEVEAEAVVEG